MRRWALAAAIAAIGGAACAQGPVRITGWAPAEPAQAAPSASLASPPMLPAGESPYGDVVPPPPRPTTTLPKQWLRLTGEPTVVTGLVAAGQPIVTVPVAHVVTGHLTSSPDRYGGWMSGLRIFEPGPVYGVQLEGRLAWCLPKRHASKRGGFTWSADCFVRHPFRPDLYMHGHGEGGLYVVRALRSEGTVYPPRVKEGPVDFGAPLRLAYVLDHWTKREARIRVEVMSEGAPSVIWRTSAFPDPDGSAVLKVLDGEVRLTPDGGDPKSARIEVIRPPSGKGLSPF
ncbi:MAG: hypothetical protein Q8Q88_03345 [Phenylobacterium sp.]|uniref:hypothetical protein n=1 Tax=Phenylobacterium sp. TaxID=1871053 RepID=UPI0027372853|nr:hypothetical protein [Phenylobacterium sp.]MDP3746064.1 hypothetical protein [Phenylobacterium sp.]